MSVGGVVAIATRGWCKVFVNWIMCLLGKDSQTMKQYENQTPYQFASIKSGWLDLVFCYQQCSDLLWEEIVQVIEKKAKNLQKIWIH